MTAHSEKQALGLHDCLMPHPNPVRVGPHRASLFLSLGNSQSSDLTPCKPWGWWPLGIPQPHASTGTQKIHGCLRLWSPGFCDELMSVLVLACVTFPHHHLGWPLPS